MKKRKDMSKEEFEKFFEERPLDLEPIEGRIGVEEYNRMMKPKPTPTPTPDKDIEEILRQGMERAKKMRKR